MPVQRSSLKTTADNRLPVGETEEWLSLLQLSMLILNCEPLKVSLFLIVICKYQLLFCAFSKPPEIVLHVYFFYYYFF